MLFEPTLHINIICMRYRFIFSAILVLKAEFYNIYHFFMQITLQDALKI